MQITQKMSKSNGRKQFVQQKDSARRIFFLVLNSYFLKTMYPSTTYTQDDEDSFELMYPETGCRCSMCKLDAASER